MTAWEDRAVREVKAAAGTDRLVLRDDLPSMIEDLASALAACEAGEAPRAAAQRAFNLQTSLIHGRERAGIDAYTVEQVTHEFAIFRHVIIDALCAGGYEDCATIEAVNSIAELTVLNAVSSFLEAIQGMQNKLLGALAHDIRTPLSVVSTSIHLLRAGSQEFSDQLLDRLQLNVDKAVRMLEGVLDTANIEAGRGISLSLERMDLAALVLAACREENLDGRSRLIAEVPDEPVWGEFDASGIRRLIDNLVSNAFKYGCDRRPVRLHLEATENEAILSVHNHGNPIAAHRRDHIFNFFSRAEGSASPSRSWGLGLAYVKMVAEAHGGQVTVESSEADGTTFRVILRRQAKAA